MPESIIIPELDANYDLATLYPLQQFLVPYEAWWEFVLWVLFATILLWKIYEYIIKPYLNESH